MSADAAFLGNINPADNIRTDGTITVRWPGDITGSPIPSPPDGHMWAEDLFLFGKAWGSKLGDARWNPLVDFDNDGQIWVNDLFILGKNWEKIFDNPFPF